MNPTAPPPCPARAARVVAPFLAGLAVAATLLAAPGAWAQNTQVQTLDRIESLEQSVKEIRRFLEEDMRALRESLEGGGTLSDGELADRIANLDSRLERILGIASDNEFRLLRLEKRLESLMRIGIGQSLGEDGDAPGGPSGTGAGDTPSSNLEAEVDQESLWTLEDDELPEPGDGGAATAAADAALPDTDPDEQYEYALGKALQNDLGVAEEAFAEFISLNPDHARVADSYFWLGRVQFMGGSYQEAAMTFSEFQTQWPNDARVEKTTLWIGESVANFAPREEACELLESLPSLVPEPTDTFHERLAKLKTASECPE